MSLCSKHYVYRIIGCLSSDVFERRTSTESKPFSLLICLDATKFVLLSVFTLMETIRPIICSKSRPKSSKSPLPFDERRSKKSLLKLPNNCLNNLPVGRGQKVLHVVTC